MLKKILEVKIISEFSNLMQIFILHFDEINGNVPLLFFPDETIKNNEKFMEIFKFQLLESEDKTNDKYISLTYETKIYLARLFKISSKLGKISVPLESSSDIIIATVLLPVGFVSYGLNFLSVITELFFKEYKELLYYIFLSEILEENMIKTPQVRKIIEAGSHLKDQLRKSIKANQKKYFSLILSHQKND